MPLCVGGGVSSIGDARDLLLAGADKVRREHGAARPPGADRRDGGRVRQPVRRGRDRRRARRRRAWQAFASAGRRPTGRDAVAWAGEAVERGAGELLVTSIDTDGTQGGYDLELLRRVCERGRVPVIASGGAGGPSDLAAALDAGAEAALAASIFHDGRTRSPRSRREVAPVRDADADVTLEPGGSSPASSRTRDGRRADARVDGRRGAGGHAGDRARALPLPVARRAVAEGRDVGQHDGGARPAFDCDADTLLLRVHPAGPACHTGEETCFGPRRPTRRRCWPSWRA